jgi:hypothetical protein
MIYESELLLQAITTTNAKLYVLWDAAPYSLVETNRRFRCAYCLHHQRDR